MQALKVQPIDMEDAPYLDMKILEPLATIMSEEQFMFLVTSLTEALERTVPEFSKDNQTSEKIASFAHELKGMASNMGFAKLSAFIAQFETPSNDILFTVADRTELDNIIRDSQNELHLFLKKRGQ